MTADHLAAVRRALCAAALLTLVPAALQAQSFGDRLKKRAKDAAERTVERRVDQKSTQATDAALDKTENAVKCAATDKQCIAQAKKEGKKVVTTDQPAAADDDASEETATAKAAAPKRGTGALNTGADFTPGTRVLYQTDFRRDEIGDFPRQFELKNGNFEVATVGGTRYLRGTSYGEFEIPLKETLPEQFTMEFEMKGVSGWEQQVYFVGEKEDDDAHHLSFNVDQSGIRGQGTYRVMSGFKARGDEVLPVQVMADGRYVKVYVNGVRVANAPNAKLGRSRAIRFVVHASDDYVFLLGPIRIAAGGKDLYKALDEDGRVTAEGIFFDTNSDVIRAESEPALTQIGQMLEKHDDLRILVEGHTDNVGGAAKNQALSDKRAAAVRRWLMTKHGIAAGRLESKGFGATKPAGDNATEDGRQKNRRVELVKL